MAEAAESGTTTLADRPVHTLDVLASMVRYSDASTFTEGEVSEPSVIGAVMGKAHEVSVLIDHTDDWDELSGLIGQDEEYEDWPTRFSSEEQVRALGFIGIISDFVRDVQEKITPDVVAVAFPNDGDTPVAPERVEELQALERRLRGSAALGVARRVFERFRGGSLTVYREAILATSQAVAEDHSGRALVMATDHIMAFIEQESAETAESGAENGTE